MTDHAHAIAKIDRLRTAFPFFKPTEGMERIYIEKMQFVSADALDHAIEMCVTRIKAKAGPSIAQILDFADGYRAPVKHEPRAPEEGGEWQEPIPVPGRKHRFEHRPGHHNCSLLAGEEWDESEIVGPDGKRRGMPNSVFERARQAVWEHHSGRRECCDQSCGCHAKARNPPSLVPVPVVRSPSFERAVVAAVSEYDDSGF